MVHRIKQDKRSKRTRGWLFETLLELIDQKSYAEISVTELTEKAGIARQTFYRNYNTKDDILLIKMDEILDDYLERVHTYLETKNDTNWNFEVSQMVFLWQHNEALFNAIQKAGLASQALEKFAEIFSLFHRKVQNLKQLDDKQQYLVYYLSGGVYMVLNKWFENKMNAPVDLLTDLFNKAASNIDKIAEEYIGNGTEL